MEWDALQAERWQDQLQLAKDKFDYMIQLDQQEFQKFQIMVEQRNFEKQYQLEQQSVQLQRQIQEIEQAYARVDAIGYVDNQTAIVLGLPVGTKAQWVKELEMAQQQEMERIKKEFEDKKKLQEELSNIQAQLEELKKES